MRTIPCLAAAVAWSASGAVLAQQHWAYRPIVRPTPPVVADAAWREPIDAFVLVAMQARGLAPSPPADRATWLRRVTLDLIGLPPTQAELDALLADSDDERAAKARVVDRLFATPAFAERWTQWWLDLARYADSQGYEKDDLRPTMWRYRDWVLDAFARDLPFDRFTIEQLAGDLLPDATDEQRLATAFHRQTMTNTEGGTDDEEFRVAAVVDRVDTTMSVWMGSTLGCAQCHDHKYDPFTQREFFQLYAFFDQTEDHDQPDDRPTLRVPTPRQRAAQQAIALELGDVRASLAAAAAAAAPAAVSPWHVLGPLTGGEFERLHAMAFAPERDGVLLDVEQDGLRWRERADYTDGIVHTWHDAESVHYLWRTIDVDAAGTAAVALGSDDALVVWWNGEEVLRRLVARGAAPGQERLELPLRAGRNTLLLKVTNGGGPGGFCSEVATDVQVASLQAQVRALEAAFDAELGPAVPVLRELSVDRRRVTRIHRRGNFLDPGDAVTPDVPAVWPPLPPGAVRDRLALARWLMAPDNPLTARVLANRVFAELFGTGLVATLEDFGTQGEAPTHPELLDWLAAEFRDGWSLRRLLRALVLSATYGQSSAWSEQHRQLDPDNRWLSRGPSFRLPAETLRDQALAVSGLLSPKFGGPSVMPAQPEGIWLQIYSGARWVPSAGDDEHRRSLYTFWRRTSPHPAMLVFDMMSRESCVLRRQRTNTPLQALVLWNEPAFVAAARALGRRAITDSGAADERGRIRWLWRQCLLREPTASEEGVLAAVYADEQARACQRSAAEAGCDDAAAALVGMQAVAGIVLTLDEFVTKP